MAPTQSALDALIVDFGNNYGFALELLEQYRREPGSLDPSWREYFARLPGEPPPPAAAPPAPAATTTLATSPAAAPAPRASAASHPPPGEARAVLVAGPGAESRALITTPILPGDIANPMRGAALRIAENMEASLQVPTATSVRELPVRTLEENRRILNKHRLSVGHSKISFTHLTAWAILRALDTFPRLNDAYGVLDGKPHRIQRDEVRLGLAVDVQKKDGSRTLLVPNIRAANRLDFAGFLAAFDDVVRRSRKGQITPDDFIGTTVSLTNPGTVGTVSSAPRLMPGQGLIVATGALDYPAEFRSMVPRTLSLLGISKVMTVTSTYDHRIIQGAESGLFLARLEELLRGEDGFYDRIFEDLELPHQPVHWEIDTAPGLFGATGSHEETEKQARVLQLINAYRVRGHLVADLDPLDARRAPHVELDPAHYGLTLWDLDREFITNGALGKDRATLREILEALRETYCGSVGAEYMGIQDTERKGWLQVRMESSRNRSELSPEERRRVLEKLILAESFERFLHTKYIGHKRFSLEGGEALIPLLDRLLAEGAREGIGEAVVGMSHRGRLSVLHNVIGKPLAQIFSEFDDVDPSSTQGSGDVKYHLGATGSHVTPDGAELAVSVAPNPSHLEFVNPVVEGMVRARQDALGDTDRSRVLPLLIHGDAAFAGQGIVTETLHLCGLEGYTTGGTVHVVVNNQIGFTTAPEDARSSTYCTDVAKTVQAPILHVNGDDPEAVVHVARLALEWRQRYQHDVVIDLVGYRRWGHNEGDEPAYTQPIMYAKIKEQPSVATLYGERLVRAGVLSRGELEALWAEKKAAMQQPGEPGALATILRRPSRELAPADPGALRGRLRAVLEAMSRVPEGFDLHPKLGGLLEKRRALLEGRGEVDWATAEALAWGTLLLEGVPVRLSGQDSGRGTFSQRHAILYDVRTGREHSPLGSIAPAGVRFEVHDSLLSEAAVMGFEFGYAVADHRALVMWEAQFGDFANGAQVIIDQFLAASETKWGQPTGLVLLLPHGHEGQGPEHSSARIERFLILCAEDNMRVCQPSTPASYYHLLRWQGRDVVEKPMIVMTPKSLLRHPRCVSGLAELAEGGFRPVLEDPAVEPERVRRVVLTSGKLYYDLLKGREERGDRDVALVRIEQLYPFPAAELSDLLARHPRSEVVWAQEEPRNMGALRFVREQFLDGAVTGLGDRAPRLVGRPASASPAPGSHRQHVAGQEEIVREALTG
jgi:2-oxoglutarate dehydrogenase E1 component